MQLEKLEFEHYNSLPAMFKHTIRKFSDKPCFFYYQNGDIDADIRQITYSEYNDMAMAIAGGLMKLGIMPKTHVAIMSETRYEWCVIDIGILSAGCSTVTIFPTLAYEQVSFIVDDSDSKAVFVSSQENLEKIARLWQENLDKLKYMFVIDDYDIEYDRFFAEDKVDYYRERIMKVEDLMNLGRKFTRANSEKIDQIIAQINEDDLSSIIYTSGTTGIPKGVMLSHKNILSDLIMGAISLHPDPDATAVTYLPLAHSFSRTVEHFGMILYGATTSFVPSYDDIQKAMLDFKPVYMIGVPYVYDKMMAEIRKTIGTMSEAAQTVFWNCVELGKKVSDLRQAAEKVPIWLKIKYWFIKKTILKKVKDNLGGNIDHFISGSAPLNPETARFFDAINIPVIEGYGLTEASPVTHTNLEYELTDFRPAYRFGKVGPLIGHDRFGSTHPYEPMDQRISEFGELLVSGPNIMMGYYKRIEETQEALEEIDGKIWLHTGDMAEVDVDGYVKIVGRAKQIIVLRTGKKVAPNLVEKVYEKHKYIEQIMLLGEGQKFISAFVVPNLHYKNEISERAGIDANLSDADFYEDSQIHSVFKKIMHEVEKGQLSHYETVKKFCLTPEFTEEEGLLSPTLKLKREKIIERYEDKLNELYSS